MRTATGIIRRIDDLGRVVIPKELRRTLKINESDPLEIFTADNGEIVLKKYSPIADCLLNESTLLAKVLAQVAEVSVLITDTDKIIARWGNLARIITRGTPPIGPAILQVLKENKSLYWTHINTEDKNQHLVDIAATENNYPQVGSQYIVPIKDQDKNAVTEVAVGTLIILSGNQQLLPEQIAQADLIAEILCNKLSE